MAKDCISDTDGDILIKDGDLVISDCDGENIDDLLMSDKGHYRDSILIGAGFFKLANVRSNDRDNIISEGKLQLIADGFKNENITEDGDNITITAGR